MTVAFRIATLADAAALSDIGARSFTETFGHLYTPENLTAFLRNHSVDAWQSDLADPQCTVFLGEAERQTAAYAKIGAPKLPFTPPEGAVELRAFYVLAPWHGSGVADAMMARALDEARGRGATSMFLSVFVDNHRARRFYERHGFVRVGSYPFMVGDHEDEDDVMHLAL